MGGSMVNEQYQKQETITRIMQMFSAQKDLPSIQLSKFFTEQEYKKLRTSVLNLKFKKIYDPLMYKMQLASVPSKLISDDVLKFISMVLGKKVSKLNFQAMHFEHRDYTLICDEDGKKIGTEVIIDLSDDWNALSGGSIVYVDGTGEYFKISPQGNSLVLVSRPKKDIKKFVHYVNALSGKKKRIFLMATI